MDRITGEELIGPGALPRLAREGEETITVDGKAVDLDIDSHQSG